MQEPVSKRPPDHLFSLVTDQWTEPYWSAAAAHRLVAPRCAECGKFRMPPTPFCPNCRSQRIDWVQLSGEGTVYSYSVVAVPIFPEMADSVPYITAVVELADAGGVRLISNIVEAPLSSVHVGAPVRVVFDDISDGVTIPRFRLAEPPA
ncbi:Nucleic-acid-binding protein containing a zn-ribbon [Sphingobium herbicidovorans NBRC 16415]|uniref:Nucleic-acid-binding protein containing a zn-ribbon n=1 Tax=Sphingobium herbicidovorans (strain ATCC 700291 / DSM 11019 / CCUG 56400 / KCTC 2939 / LMG 18315 / NBRC 16415 / MH) TaxID=1219045 RepID=A0A086PC24_SPHHM|nr:OB-fold domain-containing protein [Sphingobium herbicidovorans]KFG90942.1 Nucleic-acid-binding protein containing a zn-ribbon [Sphingobium herbicidovorans NBRC 16415]